MSSAPVPSYKLPGVISKHAWPPWKGKPVVAPRPFADTKIEWVAIDSIRPSAAYATTWSRAMTAPTDKYPALVLETIGNRNILADGHHRYWTLVRGNWHGDVPVVRLVYRRRLAIEAVRRGPIKRKVVK